MPELVNVNLSRALPELVLTFESSAHMKKMLLKPLSQMMQCTHPQAAESILEGFQYLIYS